MNITSNIIEKYRNLLFNIIMNDRVPTPGNGETRPGGYNKLAYFRDTLRIGAQLHLEDRLWEDAKSRDLFLSNPNVDEVPQYVKISFTNALSSVVEIPEVIDISEVINNPDVASEVADLSMGDSMTTTLTTCLVNPEPIKNLFGKGLHEKLYIHVPYSGLSIPRTYEDISGLPEPDVIFLEYRIPRLSTMRVYTDVQTIRYAVTRTSIMPYTSYEAGETQQDEFDLLAASSDSPEEFMKKFFGDISKSSSAITAIEKWDEMPLSFLRRQD